MPFYNTKCILFPHIKSIYQSELRSFIESGSCKRGTLLAFFVCSWLPQLFHVAKILRKLVSTIYIYAVMQTSPQENKGIIVWLPF